MTVWCVKENDWEGSFLLSIWSTEELANTEMERLGGRGTGPYINVEEWPVDEANQ